MEIAILVIGILNLILLIFSSFAALMVAEAIMSFSTLLSQVKEALQNK